MKTINKMNEISETTKKGKSKQGQLRDLAQRLASLPETKRNEFRQALHNKGIDPWKLPLVARYEKDGQHDSRISFAPLSFAQQRLWFIEQTEPGNPLYNLSFGLRFDGKLEKHVIEQSLNTIVYRHSILRTTYSATEDGEGRQQINTFQGINIDVLSANNVNENEIADIARQEALTPFDLTKDLMFRFKLVEINKHKMLGFFTIHHIAFDALSVDLLIHEFVSLYCYFSEQNLPVTSIAQSPEAMKNVVDNLPESIGLSQLSIEYADFADWQQQWAKSQQFEAQKEYWQAQLSGAPQRIELPTDFPRLKSQRFVGKKIELYLPTTLSNDIRSLAQKQNVTLYMLLMSVFNLLLSRYSQQNDICVGTSIANRTKEETHPLLGFFVNLLVMRNEIKAQSTFIEFLHEVNDTATAAYQHQDFPFDKLLDVLDVERNNSSTPLFQVLFVLNTATESQTLNLPDVKVSAFNDDQGIARYELTLRVSDNGDGQPIFCQLEYDTDLFLESTARGFIEHYQQLMTQITTHPERKLKKYSLLSEQQQYQSLQAQIKEKNVCLPTDSFTSIQQMFEAAVKKHGDAPALVCENDSLSYQHLNERVNRLAHHLRQQGVQRETPVALFMERTTSLIVGLLAVLKAGGVYIPLDTQWPQQRLQIILQDSNAAMILTETAWESVLEPVLNVVSTSSVEPKKKVLFLDGEQDQCEWGQCSTSNLDHINQDDINSEITSKASDAAYIIYTSGSTGEPKGVVIEHRQLINYILGITHRLFSESQNINKSDHTHSFASISTVAADLGNTSVYGALCFGGCLHLIDKERSFDPDAVAEYMVQHKVEVLKIVPSHLRGLLAASHPERLLPKEILILGGEACSPSLVCDVRRLSPKLRIVNHYGPTETTVGVLSYEIPLDFSFGNVFEKNQFTSIPVGRPLTNSQAYVLDSDYNVCPQGVVGELFIAGQGLARGYLRRPKLTDENFIDRQLHANIATQRLYRTGDRVRYLNDGNIEFLGRIDEQVKVRGYRVELGDIRSCLCAQSNIHDAAVLIEDGEVSQRLVAYLVEETQQKSDSPLPAEVQTTIKDNVLSVLREKLPEYMIPQKIILVTALPLTPNGKLDRRALSILTEDNDKKNGVIAPRDELERQLVKVWCEVLRNENVGVDDNFFALGGDSILSLQVIAKAKKVGVSLTPKQLFDEKSIARLARVAKTTQSDAEKSLLAIWCNILRRENIDRHDNFFTLGGDSILSLQVVAQARKAGLQLTPKQLFDSPTIAQLAGLVTGVDGRFSNSKKLGELNNIVEGTVPLTPIQQWFFSADHPSKHHWNQSTIFTVKQSLNFSHLQQSVITLIQHHDTLRMRFKRVDGNLQQEYSAISKILEKSVCQRFSAQDLGLHSLAENNTLSNEGISSLIENMATEIQMSLDLENGPLLRVVYFDIDDFDYAQYGVSNQSNRLLFVVHHLVVDGVSWRILLNDVYESYQKLTHGQALNLGEKTSSYQSWSESLNSYASSTSLANEISYWQQVAAGFAYTGMVETGSLGAHAAHTETTNTNILNLEKLGVNPVLSRDEILKLNTVATQKSVTLTLSPGDTETLLHKIPKTYRTQINDLLLSALSLVLCRASDANTVLIELEGHGRERICADDLPAAVPELDLSQTIGWFTSRFPVCLQPGNKGVTNTIKAVKEQLRAIPNKGFGYGVLRYLHTDAALRKSFQAHPVPMLSFNYLGQLDSAVTEGMSNDGESQQASLSDLFGAAQETSGIDRSVESRRSHILDLTAQVSGGCLQFKWYFSDALHERQWIKDLATNYNEALEALIQHCVGDQRGGVTPSDFPLAELTQPLLDQIPVEWNNIETLYPLSPMQEGLLFHALMNPGTGIYFMQERYQVNSALNHEAFVQAWASVVERHEVLRTSFYWQNEDKLLQIVHKDVATPVVLLDWRHLDESQQRQKMQQWMKDELTTGFDLATPTQIAITLIQVGEEKYQLIRSFHHILMDAWCFSLLMMDFLEFYQAILAKQGIKRQQLKPQLKPQPRPYRDYIAWLQQQDIDSAEVYWRDYLAGFSAPTSLVVDHPQDDTGVADVSTLLSISQTQQLQQLAKSCQITINTIVQGAWALLLSRYSGDTDIVFGVTVAGRPTELEDANSVIGLFINSLPLRVNIDDNASVRSWLQTLFTRNVSMREYEFAPLVEIQAWSDLPRGEDLFKSLFVFENAPIDADMMDKTLEFQIDERTDRTHTNYPITVVIGPSETLSLQLTYDKQCFDEPIMLRMLSHFKQLLCNMAVDAEQFIAEVEMLLPEEKNCILKQWSGAAETLPMNQVIDNHSGKFWPQRFAEQVQVTPNKTAAVCGDTTLTYSELNRHANRVANGLIEKGIGRNNVVALLGERDLDLLIMITGVLKAGAAYLPLDPQHPPQRIAKIIDLSKVRLVLSAENTAALLDKSAHLLKQSNQSELTTLFTTLDTLSKEQPDKNPEVISQYDDLAYVIFTSGSTGVPKGAMVEHLGMLNNMLGKLPSLDIDENDVIAQTASQCFDISVWQFLTASLVGAKIEIYPNAIAHDPLALLDAVAKHGVTILESVPSMIRSMLDVFDESELSLPLRWMLPTGEALPPELARDWLLRFPDIPLMNAYGPAECADDVAFWPVRDVSATDVSHMPIGRATQNNQLYVLDRRQRLLPAGVPGELYIAGAGVGRGYINDPKRTEDVFLTHPFVDADNVGKQARRFYRSGDLVCFQHDGVLEYRGRLDHQVKVRGYRIELGEIESRLSEHKTIRQAAVLIKDDLRGDACLVAYVEPDVTVTEDALTKSSDQESISNWRQFIKDALPEYMMPTVFIVLPEIPLNRNGKIDRQKLPEPEFSQLAVTAYVPPRNVHERGLVDIWKKVLKLERVGIDDNFFELGGHSLLAIKMVHQMQRQLSKELSLAALFQSPTIRQLVALVQGEVQSQVRVIRPANSNSITRPLFCIHHGGGHTLEYQSIAATLDARIPVYGIQSRRLFEPSYKEESLQSMATEYATMITDVQAVGPYRLLGWSLGGILAMAITSVLESQGHTVSFVGLIDAVHNVEISSDLLSACIDDKEKIISSETKNNSVIDNMLLMFGEEGRRRYEVINISLREKIEQKLRTLDSETALQFVIDSASELGLFDDTVDKEFLKLRYRTSVHYRELMQVYHPTRVNAAPHLWWADESLRGGHPPSAWHLCCEQIGSMESYTGSHYDIMELPALHQAISLQLVES